MLKHSKKELITLSSLFNTLLEEKSELESKRNRLVDELCLVNDELKFKTKEMIRVDGLRNDIVNFENSRLINAPERFRESLQLR